MSGSTQIRTEFFLSARYKESLVEDVLAYTMLLKDHTATNTANYGPILAVTEYISFLKAGQGMT